MRVCLCVQLRRQNADSEDRVTLTQKSYLAGNLLGKKNKEQLFIYSNCLIFIAELLRGFFDFSQSITVETLQQKRGKNNDVELAYSKYDLGYGRESEERR